MHEVASFVAASLSALKFICPCCTPDSIPLTNTEAKGLAIDLFPLWFRFSGESPRAQARVKIGIIIFMFRYTSVHLWVRRKTVARHGAAVMKVWELDKLSKFSI